MPVGVLWINQGPTETIDELIKRIPGEVPSAEVQRAEGELTLLTLAIPEAQASEGAARMMKSLILASLASGSHTPESVCNFISASFCCKRYCSAGSSRGTSAFVCCCALRSLSITFSFLAKLSLSGMLSCSEASAIEVAETPYCLSVVHGRFWQRRVVHAIHGVSASSLGDAKAFVLVIFQDAHDPLVHLQILRHGPLPVLKEAFPDRHKVVFGRVHVLLAHALFALEVDLAHAVFALGVFLARCKRGDGELLYEHHSAS